MEQIIMIEVFVEKIILKVVPPEKDEYEKKLEEEQRKIEEALALLDKSKAKEQPKKKGKEPPLPTENELRFLQSCTVQINCLPLFDFYVAHDNFVPPPAQKQVGKKRGPRKPKKGKAPLILPSEPMPEPPYFGVGNAITFVSRPSKLEEQLRKIPLYVIVWNRDENMNCIGFCNILWHKSFFNCLQKASELNPMDMQQGKFRNTKRQEIVSNTVLLNEPLLCEENLKPSGEIKLYIRLSCLGNRIVSYLVTLPETGIIPGRKYLTDGSKSKEVEVVRHWDGTLIDSVPPVAHFYLAPGIIKDPIIPELEQVVFEKFMIPYTKSELEILTMGYPKGICKGGIECPRKKENRVMSYGKTKKGNVQRKMPKEVIVRGVCGRTDCPNKVSSFICDEGTENTCRKPCWYDFYE